MKAHDRFRDAATRLGLDLELTEYPAGTRTAADAAAAIGCEVDQIVKSLVFVAVHEGGEEEPILALVAGGSRVDEGRLASLHGSATLRKATADEVRRSTGFAIGGVPPIGHAERLPTYLDPRLTDAETIWAAAGTPTHVFPCTADDLRRAGGVEAAFTRS